MSGLRCQEPPEKAADGIRQGLWLVRQTSRQGENTQTR